MGSRAYVIFSNGVARWKRLGTTGINLLDLPLSLVTVSLAPLPAKKSAFISYMRQNACHRNMKCIFEDLLPCYCCATKANSRTIRSRVSQSASADREANLMNFKLITACYQNSEPDSFVVWVSYRQTDCHCKKLIQMIRIKLLISRFLQIFAS